MDLSLLKQQLDAYCIAHRFMYASVNRNVSGRVILELGNSSGIGIQFMFIASSEQGWFLRDLRSGFHNKDLFIESADLASVKFVLDYMCSTGRQAYTSSAKKKAAEFFQLGLELLI